MAGLAFGESATAATHHFPTARRDGGVLVFRPTGVMPAQVVAGYVEIRGHRRKLSVRRARSAARRGRLRLRIARSWRKPKSRGRHARRTALSDAVLVIVTWESGTGSRTYSSPSTFTPSADAYVTSSRKKKNYGSSNELRVNASPDTRSYLRFPVAGLTEPVARATLKLYATSGSGAGFHVRPVSDTSWTEGGITYVNAPGVGGVAASSGAFSADRWLALDVTPIVKGNGALSLALTASTSDAIVAASREVGVRSPQLIVETGVPAVDTSPPTTPSALAVTASSTTTITLAWSPSLDSAGVAGYGLYLNGNGVGTSPVTSYTFSGLSCGTSYALSVDAYDAAGNRSGKASLGAATLACPVASGPYAVRGIYDADIVPQAAIGFNLIDSGPYEDQMDALAARGVKGFIWLGGYSNTTCAFNYSDDWVRSHVAAIAGHPGVGAYFIDDEPDASRCPSAPAQIKARSDLVKTLDPGKPTFMVDYKVSQFHLWAGKTDILGLDHYPCSIANGCDYSKIDAQAAEADRLGVRYWGVIQAHGDSWYKVPTPDELHQQFVHWRATNMEGYLVFAWRFPRDDPSRWLANNLALQAQLALENAG